MAPPFSRTSPPASTNPWTIAGVALGTLVLVLVASWAFGRANAPEQATERILSPKQLAEMEDGRASLSATEERFMPLKVRHQLLPVVPFDKRRTVTDRRVFNDEAAIPPQCYTKTDGRHNPCYTCHQVYDRSTRDRVNQLDDGQLQGSYDFSELGVINHYGNLFEDREKWIDDISDEAILRYVQMDNYSGLAERLRSIGWTGFVPDLKDYARAADAFDERGLAKDGSAWVAFNYKPFPGTFWPTNGSTDDVLIRLPEIFRQLKGAFHRDIYYINLTIAELNLKGLAEATLWPIDEEQLGVDLDGDGRLMITDRVRLREKYVGDAAEIVVHFEQLPMGTELMHSVRYIGLDDANRTVVPPRMKELRYMKKVNVLARDTLAARYAGERKEKRLGELPRYLARGDQGLDNSLGWYVKGFIEDYEGELRPQSLEEDMYCMGCHKAISTTIDSTFSVARKVTGGRGWGYVDLQGMRDAPNLGELEGEIFVYLQRAGGGSEFRENEEMASRWFDAEGQLRREAVLAADVASLISPSPARALTLNKAYTQIVRHQSFTLGRDATVRPAQNVWREITPGVEPLEGEYRSFGWDIRLDWSERESLARR